MRMEGSFASREIEKAEILKETARTLPLSVSENAVFVGTQRDSFARSYALINPSFRVEEFNGYCDPTAVFGDIEPDETFTKERINRVRAYMQTTDYVKELSAVYDTYADDTREVAYFVEQVTGHLIPDFRKVLAVGVDALVESIRDREGDGFRAMEAALESVLILAARYQDILRTQRQTADLHRREQLDRMIRTLDRVPRFKGLIITSDSIYCTISCIVIICYNARNAFCKTHRLFFCYFIQR